jgi:hypothetical protein
MSVLLASVNEQVSCTFEWCVCRREYPCTGYVAYPFLPSKREVGGGLIHGKKHT